MVKEENARDVEAAKANDLPAPMISRLVFDDKRIERVLNNLDAVAELPDLIGTTERTREAPNGMEVAWQRMPIGLFLMVYESRPNVTVDIAACAIRSANGVILRGGSEAIRSNRALASIVGDALEKVELPREAVTLLDTTDKRSIEYLLQRDEISLVIPRGGTGLMDFVSEHSRGIPVLNHYKGVCHVYVHESADLELALDIIEDAKARPDVCNAVETVLIDNAIAAEFLPQLHERLQRAGVEMRCDAGARALLGDVVATATEEDWHTEYLDLAVTVGLVDGLEHTISHIERYGTDHTETIVARDEQIAQEFLNRVNSSTVFHNASTRLSNLPEFGLGPELGTSTTRLHAYGPMGPEALTITKYVVKGTGQRMG